MKANLVYQIRGGHGSKIRARGRFNCSSRRLFSTSSSRLSTASKDEYRSAKTYCSNLVRQSDSPAYTVLYCLPPHIHDFYIAIRALNIELARIPDTVSHPTVGTMRMQFWHQLINSTFSGAPPRGQPVAILLASALESLSERTSKSTSGLTIMRSWCHRLITARENRLTNPPFPNLESLESYSESTYSTLLYLTLAALPLQSLTLDHLASHIGKAAGIITILRGFALNAFPPPTLQHNNPTQTMIPGAAPAPSSQRGVLTLPLDILSQSSVHDEEVFRLGGEAPGLRDAAFAVATRASDHLITARTMLENLRQGKDVGHDYEYAGEDGHDHYQSSGFDSDSSTNSPNPALRTNSATSQNGNEVEAFPGALGVLQTASIPTQLWLERLEKCDFDVFNPSLRRVGDWRVPVRVFLKVRRREI